ncbi:hypothetical protein BaRGS_00017394 [Batillaria attramentaria]|uniref:Uncharacterized protein n=1 Tax=Batillaria attramentaria TaxID=370345 RepID=A0ABD0KVV8_9CAEN
MNAICWQFITDAVRDTNSRRCMGRSGTPPRPGRRADVRTSRWRRIRAHVGTSTLIPSSSENRQSAVDTYSSQHVTPCALRPSNKDRKRKSTKRVSGDRYRTRRQWTLSDSLTTDGNRLCKNLLEHNSSHVYHTIYSNHYHNRTNLL